MGIRRQGKLDLRLVGGSAVHPYVSSYYGSVLAGGGTLTAVEQTALSDFRSDVDSIWSLLKDIRIFALGSAYAKTLAFKNTWGSSTVTLVGSPTGVAAGYQFDGTAKYLRTGLTPSAVGSLDILNSGWMAWTQGITDSSANRPFGGAWSNSGTYRTGGRWRTTGAVEGFNGLSSEIAHAPSGFTGGPRSGSWGVSNISGPASNYYRNGTSVASDVTFSTSTAKPVVEEWVGSINGGGGEYFHGTISAWIRFDGLTQTQYQILHMALERFMFAVDAQRNIVDRGDSLSTTTSGLNMTEGATEAGVILQSSVSERGVGGTDIATIDSTLVTELASSFNDKWKLPYFSLGRNNVRVTESSFAANKLADIQACINRLPASVAAVARVGEIPPQDATDEEPGDTFRTNIDTLNASLKAWLGHRFVEWYHAARSQASLATAADITDLDSGFTPGTTRGDTIHPNGTVGDLIIRNMFRASIANGWKAAATAPVSIYAPLIWITATTGSAATVGQVLNACPGGWSMAPSYTYQWKRGGVAINGATSASYTTTAPDAGASITCTVTATNSTGSTNATSNTITVT